MNKKLNIMNVTCYLLFVKQRYIVFTILLVSSQISFAQSIFSTSHNLSVSGQGVFKATSEKGICIFCHIPSSCSSNIPITNRNNPVSTYQLYTSSTLNASLSQPDSSSKLCITCHDGNQSLGNVITPSEINMVGGPVTLQGRSSNLTTDLRNDHPVSYLYNLALVSANPNLADPNVTNSGLGSTIINDLLINHKVQCTSCHDQHNKYGQTYLLKKDNSASGLCVTCHLYNQHNGMNCMTCHQAHNTGNSNIYLVKDIITTPNSGNKNVVFTAETGAGSYADGAAPYDGVCEVCHTQASSNYHSNYAPGTHNNGQKCTTSGCHSHSGTESFAVPNCLGCHTAINTPTTAIYTTDAHTTHVTRYGFACSTCHFAQGAGGASEPTHPSGGSAEVSFDPNGLARRNGADSNTPTWNSATKTCNNVYCHSNGRSAYRGTDGTDTWSTITGSQTATYSVTPAWDIGSISVCTECHSGSGNMSSPYTISSPGLANPLPPPTGEHQRVAHVSNSQELSGNGWTVVNCFWCHNTNSGKSDSPINQGTYGTSFHVDGQTYFKPRSFVDGGTMVGSNATSGMGYFSYSKTGSAAHCGQGKVCW